MHVWQGNLVSQQQGNLEAKLHKRASLSDSHSWPFYVLNFVALVQILLLVIWLAISRKKRLASGSSGAVI
jgi:hypothetical protein